MRDLTPEEKELIVNTEITPDCFEKWEDYHYEEIKLGHFPHPCYVGKFCTYILYPTTCFEGLVRECEAVRRKYLQTKNEHYFDILVRLLPNSYKVVNLCAERKDICKAKHIVPETLYQRYCEQKLPEDFQERAEGFASMSDTVQEEMFRAGFYCGLNINDVFTDPDRPVLDNGYILVRKEDLNLDWYKKTKAMIAEEENEIHR